MKFLILISCLLLSFYSSARTVKKNTKGWRESYGGDSTIAEFKYKAADIFFHINKDNYLGVSYDKVLEKIETLQIECATNLLLDGIKKQAVNFPHAQPQRLKLDCEIWNSELTDKQKTILVVHEMLPLLGIDDVDYQNSNLIYERFVRYKRNTGSGRDLYFDQKTLNFNLFLAVSDCDTEKYLAQVEKGADVFRGTRDESLIEIALNNGCTDIIADLAKYRVPFLNKRNNPYIYKVALDNEEMLYSFEERVRLLHILKKFYPAEFNRPLKLSRIDPGESLLIDTYWLQYFCIEGSNYLHFWASGIRDASTSNVKMNLENRKYAEKNIKLLVSLGMSLDQRNKCGDSPRDLMRKSGLKFK